MSELKPCPFCGGEVEVNAAYWDCHGEKYESGCANPQCLVHPYSDLYDTEAEAIDAWNTRAERTCRMTDDSERLRALGWEEVVRCRDCKHYTDDEVEYRHYCNEWCGQVTPDGFCAWGKNERNVQ